MLQSDVLVVRHRRECFALDEVGALLSNHDRRRVRVAGRQGRHHRGVDDPQSLYALHSAK